MTTELTQPQTELGPDLANGQGQPQGHRRRRRRRKNKSSQLAGAPVAQLQQATPQAPPTPLAPPLPRPAKHRQASTQQGSRPGAPPNQGRKKKTFVAKNPAAQPGNIRFRFTSTVSRHPHCSILRTR